MFGDWIAAAAGAIKTIIPQKGGSRVCGMLHGTVNLAELTCFIRLILRHAKAFLKQLSHSNAQVFRFRPMWGRGGFQRRQIRSRDDLPLKNSRPTPLVWRDYYSSKQSDYLKDVTPGFRLNSFRHIVRLTSASQSINMELDYQPSKVEDVK